MAVQGKTASNGMAVIDLTPRNGMDLRSLSKNVGSPFIQNVVPRNGEFWTRYGLGLVREYDTSLACGRTFQVSPGTQFGIGPCIGATAVRTAWDTDQLLEIRPLLAFTGNLRTLLDPTTADVYNRRATTLAGVVAVVHDLHTGRHVEFVLHFQDSTSGSLSAVYPNYATRYGGTADPTGTDHSRWAIPTSEPKWALFAPISTGIAFGTQAFNTIVAIDGMGLWTYRPIDTARCVNRMNNSFNRPILGVYMGEQGAFSPMSLSGGLLLPVDGFVYLTDNDLPPVTVMTTWHNDRTVYGCGNSIFFSDPFNPIAVLFDSRYVLPSPDPVLCIASWRGMLFIATFFQCWVYQPTLTSATSGANTVGTVAQGSLTLIAGTNGCVNNRAWCIGNNGVYFVDDTGVYLYSGGVGLTWLSKPIDRLWADPQSMQLPMTDFYQRGGVTSMAAVQLPARLDIRAEMLGARLAWDDARKTLLCVCDNITLCWTADFGWSVWLFQTHAGDAASVRGAANISKPTIVPVVNDLYLLGGPDSVLYSESLVGNSSRDNAGYLLKYGRGGALDRSTCMVPAKADAYVCEFSGYIVPGNVARITVGASNYDWTILAGDDLAATCAKYAAFAEGAAGAVYHFLAQPAGILLVGKTPGFAQPAPTSAFLSGTGVFVTSTLQTADTGDQTDADLEDERTPVGGYVEAAACDPGQACFLIGEPVKMPVGYTPPSGQETVPTFWYPISIAGCATPPSAFSLRFKFDNARWQPICFTGNTTRAAVVFPAGRCGSAGVAAGPTGYGNTAPDATHEIRIYLAGAPNGNGNEIRVAWDGTGGAWSTAPQMNVGVVGPDTLFYIGFRYIGNAESSFWPLAANAAVVAFVAGSQAGLYAWQAGRYPAENEALAALQQPMDWAVKTPELEVGGLQFRVRGTYLTAMHLGTGADKAVPGWLYGPLNTATSTDMHDYSAQAIDFANPIPGNTAQNNVQPYPRLAYSVAAAVVKLKTFRKLADTTGPKWGSTTDASKGNLLIDDAAVDTLATSDGCQGVRASVMVHGTLNNAGESVRVGKIEVAVVQVGQRRRWGV